MFIKPFSFICSSSIDSFNFNLVWKYNNVKKENAYNNRARLKRVFKITRTEFLFPCLSGKYYNFITKNLFFSRNTHPPIKVYQVCIFHVFWPRFDTIYIGEKVSERKRDKKIVKHTFHEINFHQSVTLGAISILDLSYHTNPINQ